MRDLAAEYAKKKIQIRKRLREFCKFQGAEDKDIFAELCFCIFTPGSKALSCDKAVKELKESDLLFKGKSHTISSRLRGHVRFHNNKTAYLLAAREFFQEW